MIVFAQFVHEAFMLAMGVGILTGLIGAVIHWYYV